MDESPQRLESFSGSVLSNKAANALPKGRMSRSIAFVDKNMKLSEQRSRTEISPEKASPIKSNHKVDLKKIVKAAD